jgi:hypothetical protein
VVVPLANQGYWKPSGISGTCVKSTLRRYGKKTSRMSGTWRCAVKAKSEKSRAGCFGRPSWATSWSVEEVDCDGKTADRRTLASKGSLKRTARQLAIGNLDKPGRHDSPP